MAVQTPDWLARRGGELRPGIGGHTWLVCFNGGPQYRLEPVPVAGKHGCKIIQTINGKMVPSTDTYSTVEDAVRGGLEDLRKTLGW